MIDYFTTAGSFLEDVWETTPNHIYLVENKKCNVKYRQTIYYKWQDTYGGYFHFKPVLAKGEYGYISRIALAALPRRILRVKTLDEISKGALNKVLNLGSILVSKDPNKRPVGRR